MKPKTNVTIPLKTLRRLQHDSARYRFLVRSDKINVYVNAEHIGYSGFLYEEGANITRAIDSLMKVKK